MHAVGILIFALVLLEDVAYSWMPVVENAEVLKPVIETKKNATTPTPPIPCQTAKKIQGQCIVREHCDFGPGGIDFTLYAPRGYKKPCKVDEVCCPYQYIKQSQPQEQSVNKDEFFDDDDDDDDY